MLDYDDLRRSSAVAEERGEKITSKGGVRAALGSLTPIQRFILALMLFLNTSVLGFLCLLATSKIAI
jgi:hypothetical protein